MVSFLLRKKQRIILLLLLFGLIGSGLHFLKNYTKKDSRIVKLVSQDEKVNNEVSKTFLRENLFGVTPLYDYSIPKQLVDDASQLTYHFDPRLTRSVYMYHIKTQLNQLDDASRISVPFSWYDWVDIGDTIDRFISMPKDEKFDCSIVCALVINKPTQKLINKKLTDNGKEPFYEESTKPDKGKPVPLQDLKRDKLCPQYCENDKTIGHPGFKVFGNVFKSKNKKKAQLQAASYLYSSAPNPEALVFVLPDSNFPIDVLSNNIIKNKQHQNMKQIGLIKNLVIGKDSLNVNVNNEYADFIDAIDKQPYKKAESYVEIYTKLEHERFLFDAPVYIEQNPEPRVKSQIKFAKSLKASLNRKDSALRKHFVEVSSKGSGRASHSDWRFYNGKHFSEKEKQIILSRMLRVWSAFVHNEGLVSILAHGGLLAHTYNGIPFPWDDDIDIQMPLRDFSILAEKYNGSLIIENPSDGYGTYYLDITDSLTHRTYGNGLNNIDGRFIDVQNGFYIDITALSVSSADLPKTYENKFNKLSKSDQSYVDPNNIISDFYSPLSEDEKSLLEKHDPLTFGGLSKPTRRKRRPGLTSSTEPESRYDINYRLQVYNCRNEHFYALEDLSPLRFTYFNQAPIYVPNNVGKVLNDEYSPQPILGHTFNNHIFIPQLRLWVPISELEKYSKFDVNVDPNFYQEEDLVDLLTSNYILENYRITRVSTVINEKENFIIRDKDMDSVSKLNYLEALLLDNERGPMTKDFFSYKLEKKNIGKVDVSIELEDIKDEIRTFLFNEYHDAVEYGNTRREDFNPISWDYKKVLSYYQDLTYDPDIELKIKQLRKLIDTVKNPEILEINKRKLEELLKKEEKISKLDQSKMSTPKLVTPYEISKESNHLDMELPNELEENEIEQSELIEVEA